MRTSFLTYFLICRIKQERGICLVDFLHFASVTLTLTRWPSCTNLTRRPISWRWPRRPKRNFVRQGFSKCTCMLHMYRHTQTQRDSYTDIIATENDTTCKVSINCNDILFLVMLFFVIVCRDRKIMELEEELTAVGNNMKSLEIAEQEVSLSFFNA